MEEEENPKRNAVLSSRRERLATPSALEEEEAEKICLVLDSQAAIQMVYNLSKGLSPRSQIECRTKNALRSETRDPMCQRTHRHPRE